MRARAALAAEWRDGRTVATTLRGEAPLLLRARGHGERLEVHVLGGAAGPLGGDDLALDVALGAGAQVAVRSVAAQLVQPDPHGRRSHLRTDVALADGARLDWQPQPTLSVVGSDHRASTLLRLDEGATVRWSETIVLGRAGEPPGRIAARLRLEIAGRAVLDHDLLAAAGALAGPGANGPARAITSTLIVGPDAPTEAAAQVERRGERRAVLPLRPGAALVVVLSPRTATGAAGPVNEPLHGVRTGRVPSPRP